MRGPPIPSLWREAGPSSGSVCWDLGDAGDGIWGISAGGGAGTELGKGKDGFNQLDLIEIKKKKYSSQNGEGVLAREVLTPRVPQNRPREASAFLVSVILGDFWILQEQRGFAGRLSRSPFPGKALR